MSCYRVTLYCNWCRVTPIGTGHCEDAYDHGMLCPACEHALAERPINWSAPAPPPGLSHEPRAIRLRDDDT